MVDERTLHQLLLQRVRDQRTDLTQRIVQAFACSNDGFKDRDWQVENDTAALEEALDDLRMKISEAGREKWGKET